MGGGGESAPVTLSKSEAAKRMEKQALLASDPKIRQILSDYGMGKISYQDVINQGRGLSATPDKDKFFADRKQGIYGNKLADFNRQYNEKNKERYNEILGREALKDSRDYRSQTEWLKKLSEDKAKYQSEAKAWAESQAEGATNAELENLYKNEVSNNPHAGAESAMWDLLATDVASAQRFNTDRMMTDPRMSKIYGEGGYQDRLLNEETALQGVTAGNEKAYQDLLSKMESLYGEASDAKTYRLTEDDHTAYGQAAGEITRLAGQQENEAMSNLAGRGLASTASGSAGALFSGIQGNKFELLAKAQTNMANQRYDRVLNQLNMRNQMLNTQGGTLSSKAGIDLGRLNSTRGSISNTQNLYQSGLQDMFNRSMQGRQANESALANAAGQDFQYQQALQNQYNTQWQQQQATQGPSFGDIALGLGTTGLGYATGGLGAGLGAGLANEIFKPKGK